MEVKPVNKLFGFAVTFALLSVLFTVISRPASAADGVNFTWIEAESALPDKGVGIGKISGESDSTYDSLSGLAGLRINSGTSTGIGINFNFTIDKKETYDILIRGTYEVNSDYMSTISMHMDEAECEITKLTSEGWVIKGSSSYNYQIGWQKVTRVLDAGSHTFRWQIDGPGSKSTKNRALCDLIIVLPAGVGFEPTPLPSVDDVFPTENRMDYELCTLLTEYDLTSVNSDITLPATTANGYPVVWGTSDETIITSNGEISLSDTAKTAQLTATITREGVSYSKIFEVIVKEPKLEAIISQNDGQIDILYTCPEKPESENYTVIIAGYGGKGNDRLFLSAKTINGAFDKGKRGNIGPLSIENIDGATAYKVFLWDADTIMPLADVMLMDVCNGFIMQPVNSNVDQRAVEVSEYMNDSYMNIANYVKEGHKDDRPVPIKFSWHFSNPENDVIESYNLKISENSDMTDSLTFDVSGKEYDVYNLKSGEKYYWTVTANGINADHTSSIASFTTSSVPRNIFVEGVRNVRDIGGWKTTDDKYVAQGLVYRSAQFEKINAKGIKTMHDELGIKTEIDLRRSSDDHAYDDASPLGEDVNYFLCPMEYGDYLTLNKDSIRTIFNVLADSGNYPIVYHCSAGADRTGVITYLINGLLGVPQDDLFRDYLLTNFSGKTRTMDYISNQYVKILDEYMEGEGTLQERIYSYLADEVGIERADLDFIIGYLK